MRSLMFLLVLVIFCSLQMTSSAPIALDAANSKCCMEFTKVKIPVRLVKSYSWTTSDCPRRAVVFHMISGKEFCVDPETTWVNSHVAKVDQRKTSAATTTTTASTAKTQSPTV
ncbi:monocyte chemotactic protein 1B-like [Megalobrama amblycephala]|uniref:monocyte chemotactic protein 1B-like n=1 Tax=Megalobrama amblycephala TaxID=75352 RepID=UPI002013CF7F|nr:monocyte chemotactic protein 1B-like isoform X1 [Megalobrama amblycephala]XP_048015292.1 monocyte chemotactic protein 1B-like [Megalobrama amblycephala]